MSQTQIIPINALNAKTHFPQSRCLHGAMEQGS